MYTVCTYCNVLCTYPSFLMLGHNYTSLITLGIYSINAHHTLEALIVCMSHCYHLLYSL